MRSKVAVFLIAVLVPFRSLEGATGLVDTTFSPQWASDTAVADFAVRPSGEILVALYSESAGSDEQLSLIQLKDDGGIDPSFPAAVRMRHLFQMLLQKDGKVLVAGARSDDPACLLRFKLNGELDPDFKCPSVRAVTEVATDAAGRIYISGDFREVNGIPRLYLARLHPDGHLDESFTPATALHGSAEAGMTRLAVQIDGRVLMAGVFNSPAGKNYFARFNEDGSDDGSFSNMNPVYHSFCNDLKVLPDGSILHGWGFRTDRGTRAAIQRFLPDRTRDPGFQHDVTLDGMITTFDVQPDGRIIAAISSALLTQGQIFRFHKNGQIDQTFGAGGKSLVDTRAYTRPGHVSRIIVDGRGRVLIGGSFTAYDGESRTNLVRLLPDAISLKSLVRQKDVILIEWYLTPAETTCTIQASSDLKTWITENNISRVTNGLQVQLPADAPRRFLRLVKE